MTFGKREEQVFLGRDIAHHKDYSEHTAIEIDREVRRIIDDAYQKARQLLSDHSPLLQAVAERLLEKEVLDGSEVEAMVKAFKEGRPMPASLPVADGSGRATSEIGKPKPVDQEAPVAPGLPPKPVLV